MTASGVIPVCALHERTQTETTKIRCGATDGRLGQGAGQSFVRDAHHESRPRESRLSGEHTPGDATRAASWRGAQVTRSEAVAARNLMDIGGVADRLGVRVRYVRRLVAERRIPYIKLGHLLRFDPAQIDEWLERSRVDEALPTTGRRRRRAW